MPSIPCVPFAIAGSALAGKLRSLGASRNHVDHLAVRFCAATGVACAHPSRPEPSAPASTTENPLSGGGGGHMTAGVRVRLKQKVAALPVAPVILLQVPALASEKPPRCRTSARASRQQWVYQKK